MVKSHFVNYVLFILVLFTTHAHAQQKPPLDVKELTERLLWLLDHDEYGEATNLFHYPLSYTKEQKDVEMESVQKSIEKYTDYFGKIVEISNFNFTGRIVGIGVSGAKLEYWQQKYIYQQLFEVEYQNVGQGFLKIGFCNIDRWEIQSLEFLFPASEKSEAIIDGIKNQGTRNDPGSSLEISFN